ncbi:MAG: hypothetical protein P8Y27_17720 [Chromatiaceae bacterium]
MPFLHLIRKLLCPKATVAVEEQEPGEPASIKQRGWRQWSFVSPRDVQSVLRGTPGGAGLPELAKDARLLVVSQSCDLVHDCYASEPVAEAYLCEPLAPDAQPNGNYTAGKNPRELHVSFAADGTEHWYRIHSNGRGVLQRWIINRVVRTAFPDAFNQRTRRARGKQEDRLKKAGTHLLGLYVSVSSWEELGDDEVYEIDFVGLVDEGLGEGERQGLVKALGDIAAAYEKSDGVSVLDYRVEGEDEAPMSLLRTHRLFPLDYLSLRDSPGGELPSLS